MIETELLTFCSFLISQIENWSGFVHRWILGQNSTRDHQQKSEGFQEKKDPDLPEGCWAIYWLTSLTSKS